MKQKILIASIIFSINTVCNAGYVPMPRLEMPRLEVPKLQELPEIKVPRIEPYVPSYSSSKPQATYLNLNVIPIPPDGVQIKQPEDGFKVKLKLPDELNNGISEGCKEFAQKFSSGLIEYLSTIELTFDYVLKRGVMLGSVIGLATASYYTVKMAINLFERYITRPKPRVLLPESVLGMQDRFWLHRSGYKAPQLCLSFKMRKIINDFTERLEMVEKWKKSGAKDLVYDNLLIFGPPGTGKSALARYIADSTGMDFAATTAALLLQPGAGVAHIDELMNRIIHNDRPTVLFIDEGDALLVARELLDINSEHYQLLSHFLAITGSGSDKFVLIVATNHEYVIDDAMHRRFGQVLHTELPSVFDRKDLVSFFIEHYLYNTDSNAETFVIAAKSVMTLRVVEDLVNKTEGFSHAHLKELVSLIRKKALCANGVTKSIVDESLAVVLARYALACAARKRIAEIQKGKHSLAAA